MKKRKILLCLLLMGCVLYFLYQKEEKEKPLQDNKKIIEYVINHSFKNKTMIEDLKKVNISKTMRLLKENKRIIVEKEEPMIYLYNSHPTEEYAKTSIGEYILEPNVGMSNYILEDIWNKNGYKTIVEEKSVKDILNENNWNYASSYKASRILLEERIVEYPSLTYFIDIHRDSLEKNRTTVQIGEKEYASLLFIIGLENSNYQENLAFTEKIVEKLNTEYPNLCKGIYKKEGIGVNGVYNQDFSPHTILIEIGGYENTTLEVMNSAIAFSKCFMEVINEEDR